MKKRILTALTLFGLLIVAVSQSPTPAGAFDCNSDCQQAETECSTKAQNEANECRQMGNPFEYCKEVRRRVFTRCLLEKGCTRCIDSRYGIGYYCSCGKPGWMTGGGGIIDPYRYSDPFSPTDDGSIYCELDPCACDTDAFISWCW